MIEMKKISVDIPKEIVEKLSKIAEQQDRTLSSLIRVILKDYCYKETYNYVEEKTLL